MSEIKIPTKATYAIAKAVHHANAAEFYFNLTIVESKATFGAKHFLSSMAKKAKSIVTDMLAKMSSGDAKEELKQELEDPLAIDALVDSFLLLTIENRDKVELFIIDVLKSQQNEG